MSMQWREVHKGKPANIARAYMAMHDQRTAVASAFEMRDGTFRVVYSEAGSKALTVEQDIKTLRAAKRRAETIVQSKIVVPRIVLLDA